MNRRTAIGTIGLATASAISSVADAGLLPRGRRRRNCCCLPQPRRAVLNFDLHNYTTADDWTVSGIAGRFHIVEQGDLRVIEVAVNPGGDPGTSAHGIVPVEVVGRYSEYLNNVATVWAIEWKWNNKCYTRKILPNYICSMIDLPDVGDQKTQALYVGTVDSLRDIPIPNENAVNGPWKVREEKLSEVDYQRVNVRNIVPRRYAIIGNNKPHLRIAEVGLTLC